LDTIKNSSFIDDLNCMFSNKYSHSSNILWNYQ